MFERTSVCPFTEICDSFQTINRAEKWMEKVLSDSRWGDAEDRPFGESGFSAETLEWRLEHLRKVKDRCYSHNGRCLRYWQYKTKEEQGDVIPKREEKWPSSMFDENILPDNLLEKG